jgi:hypothetical protein
MIKEDLEKFTDHDILAYFCERAAVREYDGRMGREQATVAAAIELRKVLGKLPAVVMAEVERVRGNF